MSTIQVADQTFVAVPGAAVAAQIAVPSKWRQWWPDLILEVVEDRADKGIRWRVSGALNGTMEIWLEPALDGVIAHYFMHAEPVDPASDAVAATKVRRVQGKTMSFEIKAKLEAGRPVGVAPAAVQ